MATSHPEDGDIDKNRHDDDDIVVLDGYHGGGLLLTFG